MTDAVVPLPEMLTRIAAEAVALAGATARAEVALHAMLDRIPGRPGAAERDLQEIDLVRQGLEDIARLLQLAATAATRGGALSPGDLRAATRLADVWGRLVPGPAPVAAPRHESGDLHLF